MGEHRRVDRQAVLHNRDQTTNSQSLSALPQVEDGISIGGSWYPVFRPLAKDYGVPGRGVEGHGSDSDSKVSDYLPDQSGEVAPMRDDTGDTAPDFTDLMLDADPYTPGVQTPVLVSVVPEPKLAVQRYTTFHRPYPNNQSGQPVVVWNFLAYPRVPDPGTVVTFSANPARQRVTFTVGAPSTGGAVGNYYAFAISSDPTFGEYALLNLGSSPLVIENLCNAFYTALVPCGVYSDSVMNRVELYVAQEYAQVANNNPAV